MFKNLENCEICPFLCGINRSKNVGACRCNDKIKIALATLHHFEEPCISGKNGSGTIFFTGCNLKCIYCQNHEISTKQVGREVTIEELANIMLNLQVEKAENINLVTPTMYIYHIIEAIKIARKNGLTIPIVYNTNGYEKVESLKLLERYVDVYLPDFKYFDNELAQKYSRVNNYVEVAKEAIREMYRQVGAPSLNENGIIQKGLMIRHLILPNHVQNTKNVLKWLKVNIDKNVYIDIMAQYFPTHLAKDDDMLNRKLTQEEYKEIEQYVFELGIKNGYMQELGEHEEEYVPKFEI